MKNFLFQLFTILLLSQVSTVRSIVSGTLNSTAQRRATNTCADPTTAETFLAGYSPSYQAHLLRVRWAFVYADSAGTWDFQIQGEIFRAWQTPQDSTVPFYRLYNPTTLDFVFLISKTTNPPTATGFVEPQIVGYVYPTQICGSVPLYVVAQPAYSDHWYTTAVRERDDLVSSGWVDQGISAYVLPLNSECGCSS
ncbi:hypothetical protein B0H34DRAFT_71826 [Crassisporium funariophilum]|nr:hypothetical protein B0H34DRAFT_71826 [Crassisporium funariophilum]